MLKIQYIVFYFSNSILVRLPLWIGKQFSVVFVKDWKVWCYCHLSVSHVHMFSSMWLRDNCNCLFQVSLIHRLFSLSLCQQYTCFLMFNTQWHSWLVYICWGKYSKKGNSLMVSLYLKFQFYISDGYQLAMKYDMVL